MGFMSKLLGGGLVKGAKEITQIVGDMKAKKIDGAVALAKIDQAIPMLQGEINKIEGNHPSLFVSGWRPAVGWVCVSGLAYTVLFRPIMNGLINAAFALAGKGVPTFEIFVSVDTTELVSLLVGMLGFAGYRSWEKIKGQARD
jgi:hypothetical protein